jgi:hypothetical protein
MPVRFLGAATIASDDFGSKFIGDHGREVRNRSQSNGTLHDRQRERAGPARSTKTRKAAAKLATAKRKTLGIAFCVTEGFKWRGPDLNRRPRGYEPRELPGCSTAATMFIGAFPFFQFLVSCPSGTTSLIAKFPARQSAARRASLGNPALREAC